jgi:hypothetical protein
MGSHMDPERVEVLFAIAELIIPGDVDDNRKRGFSEREVLEHALTLVAGFVESTEQELQDLPEEEEEEEEEGVTVA